MRRIAHVATAALVLMFSAKGWALGFVNFEQGASGTGITESRTPLYDDPNTVFYNPAGMVELPGFQFSLGATAFMPTTHYKPNNQTPTTYTTWGFVQKEADNFGNESDTIKKAFVSPHLYFTYLFKDYGVAIGFGTFSSCGMGTYWPKDFDGRYIISHTYLGALFNQPTVAVDIAKLAGFKDKLKLSVAAGYDLIYATASLGKVIDLRGAEFGIDPAQIPSRPEGTMTLDGSGFAHGYAFAVYAELPKLLSFGFSFHGGSHLKMTGDGKFTFTEAGQAALGGTSPPTIIPEKAKGTVELNFPHVINTGVAYLGVDRWKFILDLEFALYKDRYKQIDITFDCYPDNCSLAPQALKTDYGTGGAVDFGIMWLMKDYLELRAGGGWTFSPIPAATMDPALTDGHRITGSIGAGYIAKSWKVDLAYMFTMWKATKDNEVGAPEPIPDTTFHNPIGYANGEYTNIVNTLALSYGMKF